MSKQEIFGRFVRELETSASAFRILDSMEDDSGRVAVMLSLKATVDFIESATGNVSLRDPLFRLFLALDSAEAGSLDPMLRPNLIKTKPPLPCNERAQRGYLAAAMEVVMHVDKEKRDSAAQWVARHAKGLPVFRKVRSSSWRAVQEWRDNANGSNADNGSVDSVLFRDTITELRKAELPLGAGRKHAQKLIVLAHHLGNPER